MIRLQSQAWWRENTLEPETCTRGDAAKEKMTVAEERESRAGGSHCLIFAKCQGGEKCHR